MTKPESGLVPDLHERVRVIGSRHHDRYGNVVRFYRGDVYSVGVALDGEALDETFCFRPEELEVVPDLMFNLEKSLGIKFS